jgi:ammonium transporter, Amt family
MKLGIMVAVAAAAIMTVSLFLLPEVSADTAEILSGGVEGALDHTDMAWVMVATVLVFMMAPALALFYGGMLRKQSMTSTIAQCIMGVALVLVIWAAVGYSLAFSGDIGGFVGDLGFALMYNVPYGTSTLGLTIPDMEFLLFQGMFAGVTACIVVGASAERARFSAIMLFLAIWSVLVYAPMAHMVWGGGILSTA